MADPNFLHKIKTGLILSIVLLSMFPFQVVIAETPSDDDVNRVASQLYCPVCENIPLDACPLEACRLWRDLIRQRLAEGWTDREIKDYFVAQYGDRVLGEPPRQGLNWMLYILPPVMVFGGLFFAYVKLRQKPEEQPLGKEIITDPYLEQVERDLRNLD